MGKAVCETTTGGFFFYQNSIAKAGSWVIPLPFLVILSVAFKAQLCIFLRYF
jgi:hypothetical protein